MVAELITEELNKVYNASWLLDGFPRTIGQANMLDDKLDHAKQTLNMVVNLDVPESVILQRVMDRWIHVPSGRVYSLSYNPPLEEGKDDVTGEPLTRRPDDDPVHNMDVADGCRRCFVCGYTSTTSSRNPYWNITTSVVSYILSRATPVTSFTRSSKWLWRNGSIQPVNLVCFESLRCACTPFVPALPPPPWPSQSAVQVDCVGRV
jgi:hypothetical protein